MDQEEYRNQEIILKIQKRLLVQIYNRFAESATVHVKTRTIPGFPAEELNPYQRIWVDLDFSPVIEDDFSMAATILRLGHIERDKDNKAKKVAPQLMIRTYVSLVESNSEENHDKLPDDLVEKITTPFGMVIIINTDWMAKVKGQLRSILKEQWMFDFQDMLREAGI